MHVGDDAQLYALGLLDTIDRAAIEAHVESCLECAREVGLAERAVAMLVERSIAPTARRSRPYASFTAGVLGAALAAAFVLLAGQYGALEGDGRVLALLTTSHFAHVQFFSPAGVPLDVKAIYEPHGRWYTIVAHGSVHDRIVLRHPNGTASTLARFASRGDASYLTIEDPGPLSAIELDGADGAILGTAHPKVARP